MHFFPNFKRGKVFKSSTAPLLALLGFAALAAAQTPFAPNDPYFHSGTAHGTEAGYYGQWHLVNQMPVSSRNVGQDVNILPVWQRGITGAGVIIGIVDDGLQGNHPDFIDKFQNAFSWDFGKTSEENLAESFRGGPVGAIDRHGTSVGGVAAAQGGNGVGVTGAAPYAGVASLRLLNAASPAGKTFGELEAAAILFQGQTGSGGSPDPFAAPDWNTVPVRVKNHSYGIPGGYYVRPEKALLESALRESAAHGVIHVISAGNAATGYSDPWPTADSNKAILQNNENAITVSALGSDGKIAAYSSYGANVFVTALSDSDTEQFFIPTTDRTTLADGYNNPDGTDPYFSTDGDYNSQFGGTSSAAPLLSGIMALGVQVRPDLDVRLAKHALALTSRKVDAADSGWVTNAAGYEFNNKFGFGLVDADGFVAILEDGLAVSEQTIETTEDLAVGQTFAAGTKLEMTYEAAFSDPLPLEYVKVAFTISGLQTDWAAYEAGTGTIAGDLSAWLVSPSGTRNQLFSDDRGIPSEFAPLRRSHTMGTLEWEFLSYAYWGESVNGEWTFELVNSAVNASVTWENLRFEAGLGQAIPEPGTWALLVAGAGWILLIRWRQRAGTPI